MEEGEVAASRHILRFLFSLKVRPVCTWDIQYGVTSQTIETTGSLLFFFNRFHFSINTWRIGNYKALQKVCILSMPIKSKDHYI